MPAQDRPDYQAAFARVNGSLGTYAQQTGNYGNLVRTGFGVYEITQNPAMDPNENITNIQVIAAAASDLSANLEPVSATLLRIRGVVNAGAAAASDIDFYISTERVRTAG